MRDYKKDKAFIRSVLVRSISDDYIGYILNVVVGDIIEDLETSADDNYNEDDIKLAFGRVLMDKFGIEK